MMPLPWCACSQVEILNWLSPKLVHGRTKLTTHGAFIPTGAACGNVSVDGTMTEIIQTNFWTLVSTFGESWQASPQCCIRFTASTGLAGITWNSPIGTFHFYSANQCTLHYLSRGTYVWIGGWRGAGRRVNMVLETSCITPPGATIGVYSGTAC